MPCRVYTLTSSSDSTSSRSAGTARATMSIEVLALAQLRERRTIRHALSDAVPHPRASGRARAPCPGRHPPAACEPDRSSRAGRRALWDSPPPRAPLRARSIARPGCRARRPGTARGSPPAVRAPVASIGPRPAETARRRSPSTARAPARAPRDHASSPRTAHSQGLAARGSGRDRSAARRRPCRP